MTHTIDPTSPTHDPPADPGTDTGTGVGAGQRPPRLRHGQLLEPRRAAWLAGVLYVHLFALAIFANFGVRERFVDLDDPAGTAFDVAKYEGLVRLAMFAFLVIFVIDVFVAWLLHLVFRGSGEQRSLLAAWLRLGYTVMLGVGLVFLFVGLRFVETDGMTGAIAADERSGLLLAMFDAFDAAWMIGLTLFGLHLVVIAHIIWSSPVAPRWVAALVAAAGLGYLVDTTGYTLLVGYEDHAGIFTAIVVVPAVIGELAFTGWLLHHGRTEHRMRVSSPFRRRRAA